MAALTPQSVYLEIISACESSPIVSGYTLRILDSDVLSMRVHLVDETFIEVFCNITTGKSAFALIAGQQRIYGKDNAKIGWHMHPWKEPELHRPCDPIPFATFLVEVQMGHFAEE